MASPKRDTMKSERSPGPTQVRARVWLEWDGVVDLGPGRVELLEEIGRGGSITHAARALGMSYRTAWKRVERLNQEAGTPFVATAAGGLRGGGATLTPAGRLAVAAYRAVEAQTREALARGNQAVSELLQAAAAEP